jgi:hypothetical protein
MGGGIDTASFGRIQAEAGIPARFCLFPSGTGLEELVGAGGGPDAMIAVRVRGADQTLELAFPCEMEGIMGRDVDSSTLDIYAQRATR